MSSCYSSLPQSCLKMPTASTTSLSATAKTVTFGKIAIAEFPVALGDNPAVSTGVPIQLAWESEWEIEYDLDTYEHCHRPVERRTRKQLSLCVPTRTRLVLRAGYSLTEIAITTLIVDDIKMKRLQSIQDYRHHHDDNNTEKQHRQRKSNTWNSFSVLREKTNRALRTFAQSQPRATWAKTA